LFFSYGFTVTKRGETQAVLIAIHLLQVQRKVIPFAGCTGSDNRLGYPVESGTNLTNKLIKASGARNDKTGKVL
jgi:hypothetical protein